MQLVPLARVRAQAVRLDRRAALGSPERDLRRAVLLRRGLEHGVGALGLPPRRDHRAAGRDVAAAPAPVAAAARPRRLAPDDHPRGRRDLADRVPARVAAVRPRAVRGALLPRRRAAAAPADRPAGDRLDTTSPRRALASRSAPSASRCSLGLADQQTNDDNPRLYDFRGAHRGDPGSDAGPKSLVLFEPPDMRYVLDYYAPELRRRPLRQRRAAAQGGQPGLRDRLASRTTSSSSTGPTRWSASSTSSAGCSAKLREAADRRSGSSDEQPPLGRPPAARDVAAGADLGQRPHARAHHGPARPAAGGLVLRLAAQPGPDRQPLPVRPADRGRALQPRSRRSASGGPAPASACASRSGAEPSGLAVDVFVPVYKEPVDIVELTVAAAARPARRRGARVGAGRRQRRRHARPRRAPRRRLHPPRRAHRRQGRQHQPRARRSPTRPSSPSSTPTTWPDPSFLEATLGHLDGPAVAFVQTPQYYANADAEPRSPRASWAQQALFFGAIARGKDGLGAVFCCGTNVLFRREAFESVGRLPDRTRSPRTSSSRSGSTRRAGSRRTCRTCSRAASARRTWPRTCPSSSAGRAAACRALPRALRAKLPLRLKAQYLLSASYFLSGWTVLIYMSFPVIRLLTGGQPIAGIDRARVPAPLRALLRASR